MNKEPSQSSGSVRCHVRDGRPNLAFPFRGGSQGMGSKQLSANNQQVAESAIIGDGVIVALDLRKNHPQLHPCIQG